uniref:Amidohydrolase domain containing 2 n=1 Tax=Oryctolagus cuniculus TaxID=9986 RepID=A0A5F9C2G7_RABIT
MRGGQGAARAPVLQFTNCRILRGGALLREDLWVRGGRILDPEKLFFEERRVADEQRDCGGRILAPGFIDVQINGGFGVDFSQATEDVGSGVSLVARRILSHGVTSFCPTLVTSPPEVYHKVEREPSPSTRAGARTWQSCRELGRQGRLGRENGIPAAALRPEAPFGLPPPITHPPSSGPAQGAWTPAAPWPEDLALFWVWEADLITLSFASCSVGSCSRARHPAGRQPLHFDLSSCSPALRVPRPPPFSALGVLVSPLELQS